MNAAAVAATVAAGVVVVLGGVSLAQPDPTSPNLNRTNLVCESNPSGYGAATEHDVPPCRFGYQSYVQSDRS